MIRTIPLNKLVPSPRNVRRSTDEQADLQLKADIEARGLLQNLVVTSVAKPRGSFAVEAGERRRRALAALALEGRLGKTYEVSCLVIDDPAAGREASLAENFQRLAMNPADECLAFQQLLEQGADVEGIARRFGLTVRFVEGRLRLASLAPVVFAALGAGEISLDVAKAYAATPDRERQAWVFDQLSRAYSPHPDSIRRMMTQLTVSGADRRARFVGEEAYVAAGGRIERDLFTDDSGARWLDVTLLERLASEKMEELASVAAAEAGLAWVRPTLDSRVGYDLTEGLDRLPAEALPLSPAEEARVEALEAEIEAFGAVIDDEETPDEAREEAEGEIEVRASELRTLTDKPPVLDPELREMAGTFLFLGEDGRPRLHPGFYSEVPPEPDEPDDPLAGSSNSSNAPDNASTGLAGAARVPALSQRLMDELSMQRRDILAAHVAADPALALDLAIFLMVDREAGYSSEKSGCSLAAVHPTDPAFDFRTPGAAATIALDQAAAALDRTWAVGETRARRFDAFRALPEEARAVWLAHAVARTLEASVNLPGGRSCAFHDHLGQLLEIDVARWWRPTGANFFDRVPKSVTLTALTEVGGPVFAARHAKAKKAELAQSCERIFAGEFIGELEVKEAAIAWVPEAMTFRAAVKAEPSADASPEDEGPPWRDKQAGQPQRATTGECEASPVDAAADRNAPGTSDEALESGACGEDEGIEEAA